MQQDAFYILSWWVVLFLVGLTFLPLTHIALPTYKNLFYSFSKVLGIVLIGTTFWTLSYLKILQFSQMNLFLIIILFFFINVFLYKSFRSSFSFFSIKIALLQEGLFLLTFLFWLTIRSHEPSIHGLEKFMDYGFINSVLNTNYLPAKDIWFTPEPINYYYFGHFVTAVLIKVSSVPSQIGYNLMLGSLFAFCFTLSFSIGANLFSKFKEGGSRLSILTGTIAAFLVTMGGNLQTIYAFFKNYSPPEEPVPFWQLPFQFNFSGYWYPNATRFIPFTIHEFPLYSFVVADLHGHVLDIPFVLLTIAFLSQIYYLQKVRLLDLGLLGILIGTLLMTNILDGPIYLLATFIILLKFGLFDAIKYTGVIFSIALFTFMPFYSEFVPFVSGVGVLCAPEFLTQMQRLGPFIFEVDHCMRSPLWMLLILYGMPIFTVLGFIIFVIKKQKNLNIVDNLALVFTIISFVLILVPEFFYFKDIYPLHYRANTVFKFGYQAFIILGIISAYMLVRILTHKKSYLLYIFYSIPLFLVLLYPFFAISSFYGGLKNYTGLDGTSYLKNLHLADYNSINWINKNLKGQSVILEGVGDSYTDYARISSNTGRSTVLGWPVHEWLWRGSYDPAALRIEDVKNIYESPDTVKAKLLLKKYSVEYIYIGDLERQKYLSLNEEKLLGLGDVVYTWGDSKLIKVSF